jgi:hypothetical protein
LLRLGNYFCIYPRLSLFNLHDCSCSSSSDYAFLQIYSDTPSCSMLHFAVTSRTTTMTATVPYWLPTTICALDLSFTCISLALMYLSFYWRGWIYKKGTVTRRDAFFARLGMTTNFLNVVGVVFSSANLIRHPLRRALALRIILSIILFPLKVTNYDNASMTLVTQLQQRDQEDRSQPREPAVPYKPCIPGRVLDIAVWSIRQHRTPGTRRIDHFPYASGHSTTHCRHSHLDITHHLRDNNRIVWLLLRVCEAPPGRGETRNHFQENMGFGDNCSCLYFCWVFHMGLELSERPYHQLDRRMDSVCGGTVWRWGLSLQPSFSLINFINQFLLAELQA